MTRRATYLAAFAFAVLALVFGPRAALAQEGLEAIRNLDRLTITPLPGEVGPPPRLPPDEGMGGLEGKMIESVTAIDPLAGFDPAADSGVKIGATLSAALVRKAVLKLWETGSYSDVQIFGRPGPKGGAELLIQVRPMYRMRALKVNGNKALKDEEIGRAVDYVAGRTIEPTPENLRKLREKLIAEYAEKGYREAEATLRIETTKEPGGVALVVGVDEGRPERYFSVVMPGLPEGMSAPVVAARIGLPIGSVRNVKKVEKAMQKLSERLADAGYPDARIKAFEERRIGPHQLEISIPIEAGLRTEIEFVGNRHLSRRALLEELTDRSRFKSTPDSIENTVSKLKNLYRKNAFFHVQLRAKRACVDAKGKKEVGSFDALCKPGSAAQIVLFEIAEGPIVEIAEILFEGNRRFSDQDLKEEILAFMKEKNARPYMFQPIETGSIDDLGLSDKRPSKMGKPRGAKAPRQNPERTYLPELYMEAMNHLVGMYQEQGYLLAKVEDTCPISDQRAIEFEGMIFSPFIVARESAGKDKGGRDSPCVFINQDRDMLIASIRIDEGPQTLVSEIRFEGNRAFSSQEIGEAAGLDVSIPYNEYKLRESVRAIVKIYRSRGYMFADVQWSKSFSPDSKRAAVVFAIDEGPLTRVGRIRIEGAEATSKRLLTERLTLETGDPISPEQIEESQQRLMEVGVLDSATVQMIDPDAPSEVKHLKVKVSESKPQYLEMRGGLASVEGLRGGFEYGYRNLAGWALGARIRLRANYRLFFDDQLSYFEERWNNLSLGDRIERHLMVGIGQPHFPGTHGLLGWGVDAINERVNEPAFSADRNSVFFRMFSTVAAGTAYRRAFTVETRTGVESSTIDVPGGVEDDTDLERISNWQRWALMPEGKSVFWVTGAKTALDFRDNLFNPSSGFYLSMAADLVRSLTGFQPVVQIVEDPATGEEREVILHKVSNLVRTQATASGYIPLFSPDTVLALSATVGYVFHLQKESETWADRYFYVGGVETLRGFPEESLVCEDIYQSWKAQFERTGRSAGELVDPKSRGGEAMMVLRAEVRYPLAKGFMGAVFAEAGNVWRDRKKMDPVDFDPLDIHLRPVAGGGLRYITPLGPLSFDVGANLNRRTHESPFAWYLSIGSAF